MTDETRAALTNRWDEIHLELDELKAGGVPPGNVQYGDREKELENELDSIEYELGLEYIDRLRRERSEL